MDLKRTGRTNPNARYTALRDDFFEHVTTEAHAYLLGWIASDGSIKKGAIAIYVHNKDGRTLANVRDLICPDLPIKKKQNLVGFTINSQRIVADVCRHLQIAPGKKSNVVSFPALHSEALGWAFLRGLFDGDGSVSSIAASERRAANGRGWPAPRCNIVSSSPSLLDGIQAFTKIPGHRGAQAIEWNGTNALDLLGRLYDKANLFLQRKRDLYLDWCCWMPAIRSSTPPHPLFRWARTLPNAVPPTKSSVSDSGFDLTLIERANRVGSVEFFRTGLKIQPAFGWYFDLVPRSSISKSGYMLANGVGVIDRGYTGEILVPLFKSDPAAADLVLPCRLVQIIPRPIIHAEIVEVTSFDETSRSTGGFGSTG
jgi:deoxyuridine 5'-triphosphate nucleotidohydrolase